MPGVARHLGTCRVGEPVSNYAPYGTPARMRFLIGSVLFLGVLLVVMGFAFSAKRVP